LGCLKITADDRILAIGLLENPIHFFATGIPILENQPIQPPPNKSTPFAFLNSPIRKTIIGRSLLG
jgi:hypothetical protein